MSCARYLLARLAIIIGVCATPAVARIVNVSTYDGLRSACAGAIPYDTIVIAPGIYTITGASRMMITDRPGPVVVMGATGNRDDVVIQGKGQDDPEVQMVFNLEDSPGWTFRDLTTRDTYYHGFKFDRASTGCVISNVLMRDHGESGVKGTSDPSVGRYPDSLLVEHCDIGFTGPGGGTRAVVEGIDGVGVNDWVIRANRFVNIQKGGAPAYAVFTKGNSSRTIIERNLFVNCFIAASFGGGGTGPDFFRDNNREVEHREGIIRNNVMLRCSDAAVYINKGRECVVANNTLFECELGVQLRFKESVGRIYNNLVAPSASNPNEPIIRLRDGATAESAEGNMAATPDDFVRGAGNESALDLRLRPGSRAVDAGWPVGDIVPDDFSGRARFGGAAIDVGAYEVYDETSAVDDTGLSEDNPCRHLNLR